MPHLVEPPHHTAAGWLLALILWLMPIDEE